jgi:hypothetical protein
MPIGVGATGLVIGNARIAGMTQMTISLTWEQKLLALNALGRVTLSLKEPGSWLANMPGDAAQVTNLTTIGTRFGQGESPGEAVLDLWEAFVDNLKLGEYIVTNPRAEPSARRCVRWNGFMWKDEEMF